MRMDDRQRARKLREQGKTYAEIKKQLGFDTPKSTLSYWCKGIPLNSKQRDRIHGLRLKNIKIAQKKAQIVNKQKRNKYLKEIQIRNEHLVKYLPNIEVNKLLLAMLYLGEGAKWKSHRGLQLGSANPEIMQIYLGLLERCFGVSRKKLAAMIYYRADQNLKSLVQFWSNTLKIPTKNFYKSKPDPRTRGRKSWDEYHGVCAVFGPNTEIQLELETIAKLFLRI